MRIALIICFLLPAGLADTVVLKGGLKVRGKVVEKDGSVQVTRDGRTWTFAREKVESIRRKPGARDLFAARAAELSDTDVAGWYRLGLWAKEKNLVGSSRRAFREVVEIDADHRAARRELGYELVGSQWLSGDAAKRRKGFVLCGGRWVLPAEADRLMSQGLMEQAPVTREHRKRATEIVQALLDDDAQVRAAAREMLSEVPDGAMLRPIKKALYARQPETRILAVKTLGRIGDRTALPELIRTSMYDASKEVRSAAFRSVKGFRDNDVFYPYARALFSKNPKARVMAAHALAELGDMRGVDVVLRRVAIGIGESGRANIMVGRQQSYIQDFDVEIAQAAAIGDPIVQTIRDGIILDYKILGGWGEKWIVEQANAYAGALSSLTGRDYGKNWKAWRRYAEEQDFPRARLD